MRKTCTPVTPIGESTDTGTTITFKPDKTIFETLEFNPETLENRLRELAFLNKGVKISLKDEFTQKEQVFQYEGGIVSFVEFLNKNKNLLHEKPIYFQKAKRHVPLWKSQCSTMTAIQRTSILLQITFIPMKVEPIL